MINRKKKTGMTMAARYINVQTQKNKCLRALMAAFLGFMVLFPIQAQAQVFPQQQAFAGNTLLLNGKGVRTRLLFELYTAGLYLQQKSQDATAILSANEPMALRLEITSSLITSENMESAVREGFEKAMGSNLSDFQARIEQLITTFREPIKAGDVYDFTYLPQSQQLNVVKNGQPASTIQGYDFKYALFAIWLGNRPVQARLKQALLGR